MIMKSLMSKLKLGQHYKMERFSILFIFLSACLCLLVGLAYVREVDRRQIRLTNEPILTEKFAMSLSGADGTVEGVFRNHDGTAALMLLHFRDLSLLSTNAANWRMYYSALDEKRLNNPDGAIYVYGNTGYVGLLFTDASGFRPQASDIVLQHRSALVEHVVSEEPDASSFQKFDQAQMWVNLGAADAVYLLPLDDLENLNIYDFLALTIYAEDESALREQADGHISAMSQSLAAMDELIDRLTRKGIVIPMFPHYVGGSVVFSEDGGRYVEFAELMPGGYDFAWRGTSLVDGYARFAVPEGISLREHLTYMDNERSSLSAFLSISGYSWYFNDGTLLDTSSRPDGIVLDFEEEARADITALMSEWRAFYSERYQYQCVVLPKLLVLEENLVVQKANFTVNDSEDVIFLWDQK